MNLRQHCCKYKQMICNMYVTAGLRWEAYLHLSYRAASTRVAWHSFSTNCIKYNNDLAC